MIVYVFVNECVRDRHDVTVDPMHLLLKGLSTKEIKFKSSTIITEMPRTTNYNFEQFLFYFLNFYFHGWLMIRGTYSTISRKSLECLSLKSIFQAAFKLLSDLLKRKLFYRSDVIDHLPPTPPWKGARDRNRMKPKYWFMIGGNKSRGRP